MKIEFGKKYQSYRGKIEIVGYSKAHNVFIGITDSGIISKYNELGEIRSHDNCLIEQLTTIKKKVAKTFWVNLYESGFGMAFEDLEKATTAAEHYSFIKTVSFTLEEEVEV